MPDKKYGLIGYPLTHSWSARFFSDKFLKEGISGCTYELYPLSRLEGLPDLISASPTLKGLNVTIPYKEKVLAFLDSMDETARAIGAVNTIAITRTKDKVHLRGYNTDAYGFAESLCRQRISTEGKALVLGTGGASRAVAHVLRGRGTDVVFVSRQSQQDNAITYDELDQARMNECRLIINTTPLGMSPMVADKPPIPYHLLNSGHVLYDLVYNPPETAFLLAGREYGCKTLNGLSMLELQAEKAWEIWNRENS